LTSAVLAIKRVLVHVRQQTEHIFMIKRYKRLLVRLRGLKPHKNLCPEC